MAMLTWTLSLKNLENVDASDNILKQALISLKRGKHQCRGKVKESVIKVERKASPEEVSLELPLGRKCGRVWEIHSHDG